MSDPADGDDGPPPARPDAGRVARRAMVLYAVASRASFEWAPLAETGEEYRASLLDWVVARNLDGEMEPAERQLVSAPVGTPAESVFIPATWRAEGAAVLAWALGRLTLPSVDQNVGIGPVGDALYEVGPRDDLRLRDADAITRFEAVFYNLNWRVSHGRRNPAPYDVRQMLRNYEWPPADVAPIRYAVDGDLALDGSSFTTASADRRTACTAIVIERRRAATWLCGDHPIFSRVEMDT